MDSGVGGAGAVQHDIRVIGFPDRPGIARIYAGDMLLWNGDGVVVLDITVKTMIPFHTHFETANYAVVHREPQ